MAVSDFASIIRSCISPVAICKIGFAYQQFEEFFFPLAISNDLFFAVSERDFRLDGFTIRRLSDVTSAEAIRGTYLKIHHAEGNISRLSLPPIDIKNWQQVFRSISAANETVIIEGTTPSTDSRYFLIGKVLAAGEQGIRFRSFDGSGTWSERVITVPYSTIFSMTFGSSYITTYNKYVKPYPEIHASKPNNR